MQMVDVDEKVSKQNSENVLKEPRLRSINQKRADLQLLIECEHTQMIPFVRYVLNKA